MSGETTIAVADIFVALLVALALVAIVSRRFAIPYTVALVLFGLLVSLLVHDHFELTPELVLIVLVPGLVFEAAFRMDASELRRNLPGATILAVPGVLIVATVTAAVLHLATGMSTSSAFLIGAMISATDPVAVIATMRTLHAPHRLANLVEAESLFNDGTGIVLFTLAVSGATSLADGASSFVVVVGVSIALGLIVGAACGWVAGRVEDVNLELTLTLICAYGTYLLAEGLHESGIIATVVAGVVLGNQRWGIPARSRVAIDTVWDYLAFLLTAFVFLLIGLAITPSQLVDALLVIAWGVVAVLVSRAVVVYGLYGITGRSPIGPRLGMRVPLGWLHVLFWSGLRGAIAVALALSIPASVPDRALLQSAVFGIVLFTLIVQGSSTGLVLRWAGAHPDALEDADQEPSREALPA